MRSRGWVKWIGGEGCWEQEQEDFLGISSLGAKGEPEKKADKTQFCACFPAPGICFQQCVQICG